MALGITNAVSAEISIIVPVFNEADNVLPMAREVAAAFQDVNRSWELLFVDDASTDDTTKRIEEACKADRRVRSVRHARNAGQSAAVWTGVQNSSSPIIATLDGDLQNNPADLPVLLAELKDADFVCGVRLKRQDNFSKRISTRVARWARKTALGVDFRDTGCALRVFKRSVLEEVLPFNGWHRFLPILVAANGATTKEVPVNHRPRVAGVSKYGVWNRVWRGLFDLVGVAWLQKRRLKRVPLER